MSGTSPIWMLSDSRAGQGGNGVSYSEVEGDQCGKGFRDLRGVINCSVGGVGLSVRQELSFWNMPTRRWR